MQELRQRFLLHIHVEPQRPQGSGELLLQIFPGSPFFTFAFQLEILLLKIPHFMFIFRMKCSIDCQENDL